MADLVDLLEEISSRNSVSPLTRAGFSPTKRRDTMDGPIYDDGSTEAALRIAYPAVLGRLKGEALYARILDVEAIAAAVTRGGVQWLKGRADISRWLSRDLPLNGFGPKWPPPQRATDGLPADTAALLGDPQKLVEAAREVARYGLNGPRHPATGPATGSALKAVAERLLQAFAEVADKAA